MVKSLAIVVPVFNEVDNLESLVERVSIALKRNYDFDLVLIDDGSTDGSWEKMRSLSDRFKNVTAVRLSRNFGHQYAVLAGLEYVQQLDCDAIVLMDADLQDPPELIVDMTKLLNDDVDVVFGKRIDRQGESFSKKLTATLFYRLFDRLVPFEVPLDVGDFRVFKANLVAVLLQSKDSSPFLRGLFAHAGFPSVAFQYSREKRFAGQTKYNYKKMFRLALDAILCFSDKPFRLVLKYSFIALIFVFGISIYSVVNAVAYDASPGWLSTFALVSFFGTINVVLLALIGRYVTLGLSTIVTRPRWIVCDVVKKS